MVHSESISVFKYQKAADGFYEFEPAAPLAQMNAPSYATIRQSSGGDVIISERLATSNVYEIFVNERPGFSWSRDMFIVDYAGNIYDIEDIVKLHEKDRKRLIKLEGSYITGVDYTGSGSPASIGGLTTLYYTVEADAATLSLPVIEGKTVYLAFRDGVEKTVVDASPAVNEIMIDEAVLSLVTDDIFYAGERITLLYA